LDKTIRNKTENRKTKISNSRTWNSNIISFFYYDWRSNSHSVQYNQYNKKQGSRPELKYKNCISISHFAIVIITNKKGIEIQMKYIYKIILFSLCLCTQNFQAGFFHRFKTYFTKKRIFQPAGKKALSRFARFRKLLRSYFSPRKITSRTPILKKGLKVRNLLKTGAALAGTGALLKITFNKWAEAEDVSNEIQGSLSSKFLSTLSIEAINNILQSYTETKIKNINFALTEVVTALKREKDAQIKKDLTAYHSLPFEIFILLDLYTTFEFQKRKQPRPDDFFYVRTLDFDTEHITENLDTGLELFSKKFRDYPYPDYGGGERYLMSFSPFLFQKNPVARSLGREKALNTLKQNEIMLEIIKSICSLHNITNQEVFSDIKNEVQTILSNHALKEKNLLLQFMFKSFPVREDPFSMRVGYKNAFFPDLYWSFKGGTPNREGASLFKMIQNVPENSITKMPEAEALQKLQLRLAITVPFLKEGSKLYKAYFIDINKEKESYEEAKNTVHLKIEAIVKRYKK
jgi:hypothetical protein